MSALIKGSLHLICFKSIQMMSPLIFLALCLSVGTRGSSLFYLWHLQPKAVTAAMSIKDVK